MTRKPRTLLLIAFLSGITLLAPRAAFADRPGLPPLTPPPPDFETCRATGAGAICQGRRQFTEDGGPAGIFCGTSANPIELIATPDIATQRATRYYDRDGNLTRRVLHEDFQGTIINPATGLSVRTNQLDTLTDDLAVPGDLSAFTETSTGTLRFYLPGGGVLVHDAGLSIIGPDGTIFREEGQHDLDAYYGQGDRSVMTALCAALGSPGTP
jgi:hypothetical protein